MEIDWAKVPWPEEYAKPLFVVPDNMLEKAREFWGSNANVIPISDTLLDPNIFCVLQAVCP
jgi:hypothetical protein